MSSSCLRALGSFFSNRSTILVFFSVGGFKDESFATFIEGAFEEETIYWVISIVVFDCSVGDIVEIFVKKGQGGCC